MSNSIKSNAIKLRAIRKEHAGKIAALSCKIKKATEHLIATEKEMRERAAAIAGADFEARHVMGFEPNGSNEHQIDSDGFVTSPDFASILKTATEVEADARRVAEHGPEPAELPYERFFEDELD